VKRILGLVFVWSATAALYAFCKGRDEGFDAGMRAVDAPLTPQAGWQPTGLDLWAEIQRIAKVESTERIGVIQ